MSLRRALCLLSFLATPLAYADAPGVYAITGGTVHPVSGPEIANGIVIVRDGLIEAVGANVAIPPESSTIDAKGLHVYPGLIDAQTSLGFPSPSPPPRRTRGAPRPATPEAPPCNASGAFSTISFLHRARTIRTISSSRMPRRCTTTESPSPSRAVMRTTPATCPITRRCARHSDCRKMWR